MTIVDTTHTSSATEKPIQEETSEHILKRIIFLYVGINLVILGLAILKYEYPLITETILRPEVGLISFVCFVAIQGTFEIEKADKNARNSKSFYIKFFVYLLDLCLCINSQISVELTLLGCIFSLIEFAVIYLKVFKGYFKVNTNGSSPSTGNVLIIANILVLSLIIGKGFISSEFAIFSIKAVLTIGVLHFYIGEIGRASCRDRVSSPG